MIFFIRLRRIPRAYLCRKAEASADVRPYLNKADEPGEAQCISHWAKTGHNLGTTALAAGLHIPAFLLIYLCCKISPYDIIH